MRLKSEASQTDLEWSIENALWDNGYDRKKIQFRGDDRYLRLGYWEKIDRKAFYQIQQLGVTLDEQVIEDDDCGNLYFYNIVTNLESK